MDEQPKGVMSMIDALPSRLAFWAGVVVTAGVIFAVGFILMIVLMFKGFDFSAAKTTTKTTAAANTNVAAADTAVDVAAKPTGKIEPDSIRNIRGEGDITIVEYSDTECPFCKRYHATLQQTLENYDGQVRWAYKHLPLTSLHPKAQREALATECAADQGKFWEYLDLMMERTPSNNGLEDTELFTIADDLSLDRSAFDDCLENETAADRVAADSAEAQTLGGRGTPYSVVIDNEGNILDVIEGALPYESVATVLDSYL